MAQPRRCLLGRGPSKPPFGDCAIYSETAIGFSWCVFFDRPPTGLVALLGAFSVFCCTGVWTQKNGPPRGAQWQWMIVEPMLRNGHRKHKHTQPISARPHRLHIGAFPRPTHVGKNTTWLDTRPSRGLDRPLERPTFGRRWPNMTTFGAPETGEQETDQGWPGHLGHKATFETTWSCS